MEDEANHGTGGLHAQAVAGGTAMLRLDGRGTILDCSPAAELLLGYRSQELTGRQLSQLVTYLSNMPLVVNGHLDSRLAYLSRCGFAFEVLRRDGRPVQMELYFSAPTADWNEGINLILRRKERRPEDAEPGHALGTPSLTVSGEKRLRVA